MATEFTATVKTSGGDYTSLNSALVGLVNDITAATIKVFSISAYSTPTIAAGDSVTGVTSAATGTAVLVNAARTQILIKAITGTFQSGETVKKTSDAAVTVTLSNAGDSPIIGISCYSMTDTAAASISLSWTTSSTNYITIYTPSSERHSGIWNTSKYNLTITSGTSALNIQSPYVRVNGLQIKNTATSGRAIGIDVPASSRIDIGYTIIGQTTSYGIYVGGGTVNVFNVIEYHSGGNGFHSQYDSNQPNVKIYSSTFVNNAAYGINSVGATRTAKNVYAGGNTTADWAGSGTITDTTCASSDATATGTAGDNIAYSTSTGAKFVNITVGSEDYHIASGSALINVGTNTSGDAAPFNFTDDIDGQTRTGTWDIGADEYVSGGGGSNWLKEGFWWQPPYPVGV